MRNNQGPSLWQSGISSIVFIFLIGSALTAVMLGASSYLREQQNSGITTHTKLQTEINAWKAAGWIKEYLIKRAEKEGWENFIKSLPLDVQFKDFDNISVNIKKYPSKDITAADVKIKSKVNVDSAAESVTLLQVIYENVGGDADGGVNDGLNSVVNLSRSLNLSGSVEIKKNDKLKDFYNVDVNGDFSTNGNNIVGVDKITSTGSIYINSGSKYGEVHANCDVFIEGGVVVDTVKARRNACVYGGSSVTSSLRANGSVLLQSGFDVNGEVHALNNVQDVGFCKNPGYQPSNLNSEAKTCHAPSFAGVDLSAGGAGAKTVKTAGSVKIHSGTIGNLMAKGNLIVEGDASVSGVVSGNISKPEWNKKINVNKNNVSLDGVNLVEKVEEALADFNAYQVRNLSNYDFYIEGGYKKVRVRGVSGIDDGEYFLYSDDSGPYKDVLCKKINNNSKCTDPANMAAAKRICRGFSDYNSCFSYDTSSKRWSISGVSIAPGVAWFEGNLKIVNGTYINTFIATENIETDSGGVAIYAPAFAGYSGIENGVTYSPYGLCVNTPLKDTYPKVFCDLQKQEYKNSEDYKDIDFYALLSGSHGKSLNNEKLYIGGNITLGASTLLAGDVKAGNELRTGGSVVVKGFLTALALGSELQQNFIGGSMLIDLSELPTTYMQSKVEKKTEGVDIKIKWSRYL